MKNKTNKTLRKILSIALCLALAMSYVPMVSITAGAAATDITVTIDTGASVTLRDADGDDYYDIGTADELYAFAAAVNDGNNDINGELTADIVVNENVLTETGELNGDGSNFRVWTPIGNDDNRYTGTFDGGRHTVRGLYLNNIWAYYVGLFGYVGDGGKVQYVGIIASYFNAYDNVGGVAGCIDEHSTVENCHNTSSVNGNYGVGGVVGSNSSAYSMVNNCYNTGTVTGNYKSVGGIVGVNYGTITNCYNTGTVTGNYNIGGVVGFNGKYGKVNNCYNTGTVTGNYDVGGVVGYNSKTNTVTNSYNTGSVSGNYNVGGVAGYNKGTVMNSYYLNGCATDGNNVTQFGVGNETVGSTTADVTGQTDSKSADWLASEELCAAVGYHQGAGAANGFCDLCIYESAILNEDGYYEISNGGQLFWFGNYINTVDRTANAVLTADIDLEGKALSPIGKAANKYQGVFDGQGHTISNFNMTITGAGNWGLFGYATGEGTVIKNFSISGDVTTALTSNVDVQYGVVGQADGTAEIRNVHSSVNLTSGDSYQKKYFGGIVGRTGNITVDMCSFSGKLSLGSNTLDCVGGIVGYVYNGKTAGITNCGFYGDIETTYSGGNVGGILGYYNGENAKALTISKCLSVGTLPEGRGAIVGKVNNYGSTNAGSNNYYVSDLTHSNTNITATSVISAQLASGEIAIALGDAWGQNINNRKTNQGYPVIDGATVYCVTNCLGNTDYSNTNATRHASDCILYNGVYSLCGEFGSAGIVDGVYRISTAEQLISFAKTVNKGNTAINAKLINDIDLTGYEWTPVGAAENMYSGIFDGNGKSITIQFSYFGGYNDEKENYSLFAFIDGAEIRNLTVKGSIDVRGIYATGLVSQGYGNVIIENCISDVDITTRGIMAYASGLVGKVDGILNITNCAFTGSMSNPEQTFNSSGLVSDAQDTAEVYITNSYVAADFSDYIRLNFDLGETFVKGGGIVNLTNCYYMESLRGTPAYATQMTAEQFASGEVAYLLGDAWGQMSNTEGSLPIITYNDLYDVVNVGETGNYSVSNIGDTDDNGTVDVTDYQALVNMAVSEGHPQSGAASYDDIIRYDLVSDGYVDVLDAQLMALFVNGKETVDVYPVGDYDRNGKAFEEADIKAIKHAVENPEKLSTVEKYTSDINGDGRLSEEDLTELTAIYGEIAGAECDDNIKVYYRWGNNYATCTATAMCTICNKEVATETVETTSETLSELTCTEDGKVKYIATFSGELFDTKITDVVTKTKGHSWTEWKTEIPATASSEGKEKRICSACRETEERAIDKLVLEENVVAYYTVANDRVINLVNGEVMENATVDSDGYFRGGKVKLPSSYEKASIEAVMVYNSLSTDLPVGNGLSYYGGAFLFQEAVNPSNWGLIKTPFGGGQIGTNFILRPSLNYNKRVMSEGESYWCLAFDKNESAYAMQINDDYVEKEHWSNYINSTFTLSAEHQFKEFIVYSEKLTKEEMADHFNNNKISLSADTNTIVGRVNNGITGLGSAFAFTKTG